MKGTIIPSSECKRMLRPALARITLATALGLNAPRNPLSTRRLIESWGIILLLLLASLIGCGGQGGNNGAPSVPALASLQIAPTDQVAQSGTTLQFSATGKFSDGSTQYLTASVNWSSANPVIASISSSGLATLVSVG